MQYYFGDEVEKMKEEKSLNSLDNKTKYIIVTGGVLSGLGKGVAAASIGFLLKEKYKIIPIKCDGYLNTDPGTMNPIEHGEVYVLKDGGEVDMDFGHYERFLNVDAKKSWNLTMGKIYKTILDKERKGHYLGKTVQLIPHVTDEIKNTFYSIADKEQADVVLIEIGGTVGDLENNLFIESIRQMQHDVGKENMLFVHLTYIPFYSGTKEFKSKPTQMSVKTLNQSGIYPEIIICRARKNVSDNVKEKISLYCNIKKEAVISGIDIDPIDTLPLYYEAQGMTKLIADKFSLDVGSVNNEHRELINVLKSINKDKDVLNLNIAISGKYTGLEDSYASIIEALKHCSAHLKVKINIVYIDTTDLSKNNIKEVLLENQIHGVIIPGGFGNRGIEGKINIIEYARKNKLPFLGICLGMQLSVIEYARNVCGIELANTTEIVEEGIKVKDNVVDILPNQKNVKNKGATMRLGENQIQISKDTKAWDLYQRPVIAKRFRHRYEINPRYVPTLKKGGLVFSGKSVKENIMQLVEITKHPFFMGAQFHPELTSRLDSPSTLFYYFIKAAKDRVKS